MRFPSVKKAISQNATVEQISRATVRLVSTALVAAGMSAAEIPESKANTEEPNARPAQPGGVFVMPPAPSITLTDGTTEIIATHYSHSSHVSHSSHASHCSGASWCG